MTDQRTALVTGAARGSAIARRLAADVTRTDDGERAVRAPHAR